MVETITLLQENGNYRIKVVKRGDFYTEYIPQVRKYLFFWFDLSQASPRSIPEINSKNPKEVMSEGEATSILLQYHQCTLKKKEPKVKYIYVNP